MKKNKSLENSCSCSEEGISDGRVYKKENPVVVFLYKLEDKLILVFLYIALFISIYAIYDSYMVYEHAVDSSILQYKPGYDGDEKPDKPISDDMVAWLTIDDTSIDYPIMQGETNEKYLSIDPYGNYSISGSIFLDSSNSPDFSDPYSLIYGHHMEAGAMFGALDKYKDQSYFDSHREGTLTVGDTVYDITFFATVRTQATNYAIFSPSLTSLTDVFRSIKKEKELIDENGMKKAKISEKIIALSTCQSPDTLYRLVLFGYLSKNKRHNI